MSLLLHDFRERIFAALPVRRTGAAEIDIAAKLSAKLFSEWEGHGKVWESN